MRFLLPLFCWILMSLQLPLSKGYINDMTSTLSQAQTSFLDQQLRAFEAMEGVQIIAIVIPSLEGKSIEDTSNQIASEWQVGPRGRDSGILVLIAKKEGKSSIDLGYGMEANITDEMANAISSKVMDPLLARGKVYKALEAGIGKIFNDFGKGIGDKGPVNVGSFWDMTSLLIFLLAIPLLYFIARFAASEHMWVSPTLGFLTGLTQSLGLAVALGCLGGLMVLICYVVKTYIPPRQ